MLEATATVVAAADGCAWVESEARSACGHCGSASHCGTGALAKVFGRRVHRMKVINTLDAAVGDRVIVGIADGQLSRLAAIAYLLPLGIMVLAASGADLRGWNDASVAFAALAGLDSGLLLVGRTGSRSDRSPDAQLLRHASPTFSLSHFNRGTDS